MIEKRKPDECRLTIFTPVYNRAHCIEKCYRSLLRQKNQNFIWIIVDDGSVDGLSGLVQSWMDKGSNFRIEFYRKENGGIHTAYNLALSHVHTDYWVCIDSDDWLADNAVNIIYEGIKYCEKHQLNVCGMVGLDADPEGNIFGGKFPAVHTASLMELKFRYKHRGDIKVAYRTASSAPFLPIPEIPEEKNFNPYYIMLQMDRTAPLLIINKVLCIVDYQDDGMSANLFRQYEDSPVSFGMFRLQYLKMPGLPWRFRYKQWIHYVSSWLFALEQHKGQLWKQQQTEKVSFRRLGIATAFLPGVLLHLYIFMRNRLKK